MSFINDCTCVTCIFLLINKSDVNIILPDYCSMINAQFGVNIKKFRLDNTRYYFNQNVTSYFQIEVIVHESLRVNTSQM